MGQVESFADFTQAQPLVGQDENILFHRREPLGTAERGAWKYQLNLLKNPNVPCLTAAPKFTRVMVFIGLPPRKHPSGVEDRPPKCKAEVLDGEKAVHMR
jgi:hypothetical protein